MTTRDRLADLFPHAHPSNGLVASCDGHCWCGAVDRLDRAVKVVEQIAAERAAEELRAIGRAGLAAEPGVAPVRIPVSYLFQRADALDPARAAGLTDKDERKE